MSDKKAIAQGDLVTIKLNDYHFVSNTYMVHRKLEKEALLSHPLAPDCFIIKADEDLNVDFPTGQNQIEKCLFFAKKNISLLGHTMGGDLDALCYYFVIKKSLTVKQRTDLGNICGKIASVVLNSNISAAVMTIKQNKVLLDEYNNSLLNGIKRIIDDPMTIKNKYERYMVFNIAGFALAQLSNS